MMDWLRTLRDDLRAPRQSFAINLLATVLGLGLYGYTYLAEIHSPLALLIDSVELKTYDTRFKIRGQVRPSPDILIVAIDQKTIDDLGAWPFSRVHYARMLENLKQDGAAVVGFDVTFPKPDEKSGLELVRRIRATYLERTPASQRDLGYLARLDALEREADTDARFAEALRQMGNVVLGQYFFFNPDEVGHIDAAPRRDLPRPGSLPAPTQPRGLRRRRQLQLRLLQLRPRRRRHLPQHQPGHQVQRGFLSFARRPNLAPLPPRARPGVRPFLQRGRGRIPPVRRPARPYRPHRAHAHQLPGRGADLPAHPLLRRGRRPLPARHLPGEDRAGGRHLPGHLRRPPRSRAGRRLPRGRNPRQRPRHHDRPALHPP